MIAAEMTTGMKKRALSKRAVRIGCSAAQQQRRTIDRAARGDERRARIDAQRRSRTPASTLSAVEVQTLCARLHDRASRRDRGRLESS